MEIVERLLNGVSVISAPRYEDDRGSFIVPYESETAELLGLPSSFVQDNHSISRRAGTLRGLHLQLPPFEQGKLIRVLHGEILDVFVDLRSDSPSFGQHGSVKLRGDDGLQVWIPGGFGHGFLTTAPDTEVFYKVDAPYKPEAERTLAWDDTTLGIDWANGKTKPVLSPKDSSGLSFAQIFADLAGVRL